MKKVFLTLCLVSLTSLVACNKNTGPEKTTYENFYSKTQAIEDHTYSRATLVVSYHRDITQGETPDKMDIDETCEYTWNSETNLFVPVGTYRSSFEEEISRTVKSIYKNRPQENEDSISLGYQYYINPFVVYVDYTETYEGRTVRTVQSTTYNEYGYITNYLLEATVSGTYKDQPISGVEKTVYSVSYQ